MKVVPALVLAACATSSPQAIAARSASARPQVEEIAPNGAQEMFERAGSGLAQAEARSGDLMLSCEPKDSVVFVDGMPWGSCGELTDRHGLSLGQRMRKVEVRREGYTSFETFVEPDGTRAALTVTLQPSNTGGSP